MKHIKKKTTGFTLFKCLLCCLLFLPAFQINSFNIETLDFFHNASNVRRVYMNSEPKKILRNNKIQIKQNSLETLWNGHFSATNFSTPVEKKTLENMEAIVEQVIKFLPSEHTKNLQDLTINNKYHVARGQASDKKIILNTQSIDSDDELLSVLVHEIGHIVDLGLLKGNSAVKSVFRDGNKKISINDLSLKFYRISWLNSNTLKAKINRKDFVSGYAMTDPFEDFAESYLMYTLHGKKFREISTYSEVLKEKYDFLKDEIFEGKEFSLNTKEQFVQKYTSVWDATLLPVVDF